jgi:hypothetical protein
MLKQRVEIAMHAWAGHERVADHLVLAKKGASMRNAEAVPLPNAACSMSIIAAKQETLPPAVYSCCLRFRPLRGAALRLTVLPTLPGFVTSEICKQLGKSVPHVSVRTHGL